MILDTNAISALLGGDSLIGDALQGESRHHLPVIVIGEYRCGLARSRDRNRLSRLFELLIDHSAVLSVEIETTTHYAVLREDLRRRGRPIPMNDLWVAALARQYDLPIVTRDDHFAEIPGLRLVSW